MLNVADVWEQAEECRIRFKASAAKLPRQTHPPRRHGDGGEAAKYESLQQFFRIQYFMVLDKVIGSIQERFYSPAWKVMNAMERLLVLSIRGEEVIAADVDTVLQHSAGDLDSNLLTELQQLRHITTTDAQRQSVSSFAMGLDILRKERPLLRLLPQVVTLVKLLCVLPCSTATPERSFSQLRRIKNYMRSTMGQPRLNHLMVTAVHRGGMKHLDVDRLIAEFVLRNDERRKTFAIPH